MTRWQPLIVRRKWWKMLGFSCKMDLTKDRAEAVQSTPTPALSEAQNVPGVQHLMNLTISPDSVNIHNLADDVAEFRRVYRQLVYETRQSPGSGRLCAALGWSDDRYACVESQAYVGDIVYEFFDRPEPDARQRKPIPLAVRAEVWDKTDGACWYCGRKTNPFKDFTVDHVHPVALGGTNDIDNLVPACRSCNSSKGCRA